MKVWLYVSFRARFPELHDPSPAVTVWSAPSWFVQTTVVPGATVIGDGLKAKFLIVTAACVDVVVLVGRAVGMDVGVVDGIGAGIVGAAVDVLDGSATVDCAVAAVLVGAGVAGAVDVDDLPAVAVAIDMGTGVFVAGAGGLDGDAVGAAPLVFVLVGAGTAVLVAVGGRLVAQVMEENRRSVA